MSQERPPGRLRRAEYDVHLTGVVPSIFLGDIVDYQGGPAFPTSQIVTWFQLEGTVSPVGNLYFIAFPPAFSTPCSHLNLPP